MFVADAVTREELGRAYASVDAERYYREIEAETRKKMNGARDALIKRKQKNSRLLDVGSGNGLFLQILHESGFTSLSAHDIPGAKLKSEDIAERVYLDHDYASVEDASFDVVTLLDVAEHVPDPAFLLEACARVLKPGGLVCIHTPVVTWLDRRFHLIGKLPGLRGVARLWQAARTSIFHLQNFTPRALRELLRRAGFDQVEVEVRNELSWPLRRYVEKYLLRPLRLPRFLAVPCSILLWPVMGTRLFNGNKAVVWARKSDES